MDTGVLREVLEHKGPFASIYIDGSHDTEDATKEGALRWRAVRARLVEQEPGESTLAALDEAMDSRSPAVGRAGRFVVAAGDGVLIDEYLPAPPAVPVARVSSLPYLLPLAAAGKQCVPHVVVLVDQIGAELRAVDGQGGVLADYSVTGRDHPVHKVRGAGWSHRNVQRRAEATVKHNVDEVARETAHLVQRTRPRLLVLAGDPTPRAQLHAALPASCREIAVELDTGRRASGSDRGSFQHDVAEVVAQRWRAERDAVLERFRAELGRDGGRAVQGLRPTTEALREANVEALVISESGFDDKEVWTGSNPRLVAVEQADLHTIGTSGRVHGRADEALPAAAIAVGARLLADAPERPRLADGVGALLRHT